jgi:hypothetical protein
MRDRVNRCVLMLLAAALLAASPVMAQVRPDPPEVPGPITA